MNVDRFITTMALLRLNEWWYLLGIYSLGILLGGIDRASVLRISIGLACSVLYLAHGYLVNEYMDEVKPGRATQKAKIFRQEHVYIPLIRFLFFSLPLLNLGIAVIFLPPVVSVCLASGTLCSWLYSCPPLRARRFPRWSLVLNSIGFSMLFLIGWGVSGSFHERGVWAFLYVLFLFLPIDLMHSLSDMEEDSLAQRPSFAVYFGALKTVVLAEVLVVVVNAIALIGFFRNAFSAYFLVLSVICGAVWAYILGRYRTPLKIDSFKTIKKRVRILMMVFGLLWLLELTQKGR